MGIYIVLKSCATQALDNATAFLVQSLPCFPLGSKRLCATMCDCQRDLETSPARPMRLSRRVRVGRVRGCGWKSVPEEGRERGIATAEALQEVQSRYKGG